MLNTNETETVEATPAFVVRDLDLGLSRETVETIYSAYGKFQKR